MILFMPNSMVPMPNEGILNDLGVQAEILLVLQTYKSRDETNIRDLSNIVIWVLRFLEGAALDQYQ
jgi:hypothetical protein